MTHVEHRPADPRPAGEATPSGEASPAAGPLPADGALLRCPLIGGPWAESIPPAPAGCSVSVSFTHESSALEHAEALALLGYRVVGVAASALDDGPAVHVLVDVGVLHDHPRWWRSLTAHADRAYNLAAGPVLAAVDGVLAQHALPAAP